MKNIIIIVILIFISSCVTNHLAMEGEQVLLKLPEESKNTKVFKKYFELESILPIETNDTFLLSGIKKVINYKDKIIILDKTSYIFIVNAFTGKIENYINKIGTGPGESKQILDIAFDDQNENILAYNDYNKLLFFNLHGEFLKEERIDRLYENIICEKRYVYFYNMLNGYSCYPYLIDIYNLDSKTWDKKGNNNKLEFPTRAYGKQIVKSMNIWFSAPSGFDIYKIYDMEITSPYKLEAVNSITTDLLNKSVSDPRFFFQKIHDDNILYGVTSIRETRNFIFFKSNLSGFFILNKETEEVYWESFINEEYLGLNLLNYYPHEGNDNKIMFIVQAQEWLNRIQINPDNIPEKWKKFINSINIQEDDNPILLFYRERHL